MSTFCNYISGTQYSIAFTTCTFEDNEQGLAGRPWSPPDLVDRYETAAYLTVIRQRKSDYSTIFTEHEVNNIIVLV